MKKKNPTRAANTPGKTAELLERTYYTFRCGISAYQEELNIEQEEQLSVVLKEIEIGSIEDISKMKLVDFINLVFSSKMIPKVFNVILITTLVPDEFMTDKGICWDKIKSSERNKVLADFFTYSPGLLKMFGIGEDALGILLNLIKT